MHPFSLSASAPALGTATASVSPPATDGDTAKHTQSTRSGLLRFTLESANKVKPIKPPRAASFRRRSTKTESDIPPFVLSYVSNPIPDDELAALLQGMQQPMLQLHLSVQR
jgi:hypothetical protein